MSQNKRFPLQHDSINMQSYFINIFWIFDFGLLFAISGHTKALCGLTIYFFISFHFIFAQLFYFINFVHSHDGTLAQLGRRSGLHLALPGPAGVQPHLRGLALPQVEVAHGDAGQAAQGGGGGQLWRRGRVLWTSRDTVPLSCSMRDSPNKTGAGLTPVSSSSGQRDIGGSVTCSVHVFHSGKKSLAVAQRSNENSCKQNAQRTPAVPNSDIQRLYLSIWLELTEEGVFWMEVPFGP